MGTAQSILTPSDRDTVLQAPPGYVTPKWPGLYTPTWSVRRSNGNGTDVLPGNYLFEAVDIWHYTLYWHLVFHALIFGFPALWCTLVLLFSPTSSLSMRVRSRRRIPGNDDRSIEMTQFPREAEEEPQIDPTEFAKTGLRNRKVAHSGVVGITATGETIQLSSVQPSIAESSSASSSHTPPSRVSSRSGALSSNGSRKARARKSAPIYLAFIPLVFLLLWGMASALIMSTIIGFVLAAVYNTTGFEMATWVPFLWGCIEASIVIITSWSTFTTIL